jgi:hypothetical protein
VTEDHEKPDIAQLAREAADAVAKLAVEVGHLIVEGVRTAWEAARATAEGDAGDTPPPDASDEDRSA